MALFTDGPINGTAQIQDHENAVLDVTLTENIDLDVKVRLAQEEIGTDLLLFLLRRQPWMDALATNRRRAGLGDVAVTAPLQRWHAFKTLAIVYRDAYNNRLNDRYKGKWADYEQLAAASAHSYYEIGVGLVGRPISKAETPSLSVSAGEATGGTFYVAAAWRDDDGQEGAVSEPGQMTSIAGQIVVASAVSPPDHATGWNVYAGYRPDVLALQNGDPIAIGSSWAIHGGLNAGRAPGAGQSPVWYVVDQRVTQRG